MSTVLIVSLFFLNALLMPLVVELVKERAPGLALWVMTLAVRLLPRAHRDRYRQEWAAELEEMERQNVSQLVSSLRILLSAPAMGWVLHFRNREVQINWMSEFLKELSESGIVEYDGEDTDWILGLTMRSKRTIDATSWSTVDVGGGKSFDGGLWSSGFGQRYFELQREAISRGVAIRRVFIIDWPERATDVDFLRLCRQHNDLGIHVRVLERSKVLDVSLSDFIVFDGVLSYEVAPTSLIESSTSPEIVKTHLVLQEDRVKNRIHRFDDLWSTASEV